MNGSTAPIKLAIVGPGRMGSIYARLACELAASRLIAVCGRREESTHALAKQYDVPGYANGRHEEMLAAHPEIDALIVSSSEWAHTAPVLAAIDAGKHVLVEKPMAIAAQDAAEMVRRADAAGVTLMVGQSLRFDPRFAAMRQAVSDGKIGRVLHAYARRNPPQIAVERVVGRFPLAYWLMPHDIDMMLWTVGQPIIRVMAYSGAGGHERSDFIIAVLTFRSGAIGVVESSWGTPAHGGRAQTELFTVRGTAGAAEVMGHENGVGIYPSGDAAEYPDTGYAPVVQGEQDGIFRREFRHFVGVIQGQWPPVVTGRDGLNAIQVAAAVERSLSEEREVAVHSE